MIPLPGAILSECRLYRYMLSRTWDISKGYVIFVGLNPSTADENDNDNTINKLIRYAKYWGYGGIIMLNIFAYRATEPKDMKKAKDPVGPENTMHMMDLIRSGRASTVVAMWGNHGAYRGRGAVVRELLKGMEFSGHIHLTCFEVSKKGYPKHPLYLDGKLKPISY